MILFELMRKSLRGLLWRIDLWLMPIPRNKRTQLQSPEPESALRDKILRNVIDSDQA